MRQRDTADRVVGDKIDRRYVLKREIAGGGAGTVFEATHAVTGRQVAIKLLHGRARSSDECRQRLLIEARSLAAVRHPNIVEVLDAGLDYADEPYLVLEMLEGRPLDGIVTSRQRLDPLDVAHVARQLCDALAFMHARGVVHRDLKPGNVFITRDAIGQETVKLLDFGIASVPSDLRAHQPRLTSQGGIYGTAEYMAPEQLLALDNVDHRCDQYALGVMMYEALTGELPYTGTYPEIMLKVMGSKHAPDLRAVRPELTAALAEVVQRMLARAPADRFSDAMSLGHALVAATGASAGRSTLLGAFVPMPGVRSDAQEPETAHGQPPASNAQMEAARRRRFARAPYLTPVRMILANGTTIDARSEDISQGGMLVMADRECPVNEQFRVRFALPTTGEIITAVAVARWVRPARGRSAIGVEFSEIQPNLRASVASYVALMCSGQDGSVGSSEPVRRTAQGIQPTAAP